jgi:hypothetical protein
MIALHPHSSSLGSIEQFGLDVLLDLSRLLRYAGDGDVVRLRVAEGDVSLSEIITKGWPLSRAPGVVTVPRGALRVVGEIVGAAAEQRSSMRDRFERVPSSANALVAAGVEREPIVSRCAVELRRAALDVADRRPIRLLAPWPDGKRWAAAFSHDLDVVQRWPAFTALRLAELARKGEVARAVRVVAAAARSAMGDPVWSAVQDVLRVERERSVHSTWFILCGTPTWATMRAGDLTYVPESAAARRIIAAAAREGHELGLHGSFQTYTDEHALRAQGQRLAHLANRQLDGVRQHYLRMLPGVTQRSMIAAGFAYDSTFGFADRNGFRLGVADIVPAWSDAQAELLAIDEVPFIWMDRALSKYQGLESPTSWVVDALKLASTCREVEGLWTGIWHPNLAPALGFPGAPGAFASLVRDITAQAPYVASMGELVAWRRARRHTRATALRPDGSVTYGMTGTADARMTLENGAGRPTGERAEPAP